MEIGFLLLHMNMIYSRIELVVRDALLQMWTEQIHFVKTIS